METMGKIHELCQAEGLNGLPDFGALSSLFLSTALTCPLLAGDPSVNSAYTVFRTLQARAEAAESNSA
jgi:hypothetical protein